MVSFRSRYRRAMRTAADWLHGDHLGSASWRRIGAVTALTERTFTGQALDSRTGLGLLKTLTSDLWSNKRSKGKPFWSH